jgi:hypothetical protein
MLDFITRCKGLRSLANVNDCKKNNKYSHYTGSNCTRMFNPALMRGNYEMLVYIKINSKITGGDMFIRKGGEL